MNEEGIFNHDVSSIQNLCKFFCKCAAENTMQEAFKAAGFFLLQGTACLHMSISSENQPSMPQTIQCKNPTASYAISAFYIFSSSLSAAFFFLIGIN